MGEWKRSSITDTLPMASVKAEYTTVVFQTQTLRTQPYHKAKKQTTLSTMATFTYLITSWQGFQKEHWKHVSQNLFPLLFHSNAEDQEGNSKGTQNQQKTNKQENKKTTNPNPKKNNKGTEKGTKKINTSFSITEFLQMCSGFKSTNSRITNMEVN